MIKRSIFVAVLVAGFLARGGDAQAQSDSIVPIAANTFHAEVDVPRFEAGLSFNLPVQPRLQLGPVKFAAGSAVLTEVEQKHLRQDLIALRAYPNAKVRIVVFGDGAGGLADSLAKKRAAAISALLTEADVDPARIEVDLRARSARGDPAPSDPRTRIIDIVTAG